jgi:predicted CoA-binding protein
MALAPAVDQATQLKKENRKPHIVWMQLQVVNKEAAAKARVRKQV